MHYLTIRIKVLLAAIILFASQLSPAKGQDSINVQEQIQMLLQSNDLYRMLKSGEVTRMDNSGMLRDEYNNQNLQIFYPKYKSGEVDKSFKSPELTELYFNHFNEQSYTSPALEKQIRDGQFQTIQQIDRSGDREQVQLMGKTIIFDPSFVEQSYNAFCLWRDNWRGITRDQLNEHYQRGELLAHKQNLESGYYDQIFTEPVLVAYYQQIEQQLVNGGGDNGVPHPRPAILKPRALFDMHLAGRLDGLYRAESAGDIRRLFDVLQSQLCLTPPPPIPPCNTNNDAASNWTHTILFDGSGATEGTSIKVSESRSFADYLSRPTQVQTKIFSNSTGNRVLASQTIYDAMGRGVLQTLPAPTGINDICYQTAFVTNPAGSPYTYNDFDKDATLNNSSGEVNNPKTIGNSIPGTLGWYYSNNNTTEKMVPASGYPYSRIEYFNDPTGQVRRVSAPGEAHKMGAGHEIKTFMMPASGELMYLFGLSPACALNDQGAIIPNRLGADYKITKTITMDANGVESVTFTDIRGNVLATCLSGQDNGQNVQLQKVLTVAGAGSYADIHLPAGCQSSISITGGSYDIQDRATGKIILSNTVSGLQAGYYRIINRNTNTALLNIFYDLNYYNFTLYHYDLADRLLMIVPPKGIDKANLTVTRFLIPNHAKTINGFQPYNADNMEYTTPMDMNFPAAPAGKRQRVNLYFRLGEVPGTGGCCKTGLERCCINTAFPAAFPGLNDETSSASGDMLTSMPPGLVRANAKALDQSPGNGMRFNRSAWTAGMNTIASSYSADALAGGGGTGGRLGTFEQVVGTYVRYEMRFLVVDNANQSAGNMTFTATYSCNRAGSSCAWTFAGAGNLGNAYYLTVNNDPLTMIRTLLVDVQKTEGDIIRNTKFNTTRYEDKVFTDNPAGDPLLDKIQLIGSGERFVFDDCIPNHTMQTKYNYNSLGWLLWQETPDAGKTEYVYRKDGSIKFSQNAQQRLANRFSYTLYDEQGRVTEVGEYNSLRSGTGTALKFENHYTTAPAGNSVLNASMLEGTGQSGFDESRASQQSYFAYDVPATDLGGVLSAAGLSATDYTQRFLLGKVSRVSNENSTCWYSYDELGRMLWKVEQLPDIGVKTMNYTYDFLGNITEEVFQKENASERFEHHFTYDQDKRPTHVYTSLNGIAKALHARYFYYTHGALERTELGSKVQGMDYVYNIQGWLKAINSSQLTASADPGKDGDATGGNSGVAKDVFGLQMEYFGGDYARSGSQITNTAMAGYDDLFNGNVKGIRWQDRAIGGTNAKAMYAYKYDRKNQLNSADFGTVTNNAFTASASGEYKEFGISYDDNGNILSLKRNGNSRGNSTATDNMSYNYNTNTNQLNYVADAVNTTVSNTDIDNQTTGNYIYDAIGQMTTDRSENLSYLYDVYGKVTDVTTKRLDQILPVVEFKYDAYGYRIKKIAYSRTALIPVIEKETWYVRDAAGNILSIYEREYNEGNPQAIKQAEIPLYGTSRIGTYYRQSNTYLYEITDHLGNVRATINRIKRNGEAEILDYADYYPYGTVMPMRNQVSSFRYRYDYQGQFAEKDKEFTTAGLSFFELRNWDGRLGRWNTTDAYGEFHSPYLGMGNNPVVFLDPDGGQVGNALNLTLVDGASAFSWTKTLINVGVNALASLERNLNDLKVKIREDLAKMREQNLREQQARYPLGKPQARGGSGGLEWIGGIRGGANAAIRVINTTKKAKSAEDVLALAHRWLRAGYKEIAPGVYRSADKLRQFRITESELLNKTPHANFEIFDPGNLRKPVKNIHVPFKNP